MKVAFEGLHYPRGSSFLSRRLIFEVNRVRLEPALRQRVPIATLLRIRCVLTECSHLVYRVLAHTRVFGISLGRPGEHHKPCADSVRPLICTPFCPTDSFCAPQVDQTEWIGVLHTMDETAAPGFGRRRSKGGAQVLRKACTALAPHAPQDPCVHSCALCWSGLPACMRCLASLA